MIKYVITEEGKQFLEAVGDIDTLSANVMVLIKRIYDSFKSADERDAKAFVYSLVICLTNPDSPLFQEVKND